jgi:glycosyltransferase involved in cell wall biosynthesis
VSRTLQRHYAAAHGRVPHCIPNAVTQATDVRPAPAATAERLRALALEPDSFVLFAGRLSPEKGVHTLLAAMRDFTGRKQLVLAGGTSYSDGYIESLRRQAGDGVRFLGSVDRETMHALYSHCYAYVLPSAMEGLSVGLLEALSFGTCIITTDIAENVEVVGDAALTFPFDDAAALRARLATIIEDPSVVHSMRARARERARSQPDWDEITRRTEALYLRLVFGAEARPELFTAETQRTRSHA